MWRQLTAVCTTFLSKVQKPELDIEVPRDLRLGCDMLRRSMSTLTFCSRNPVWGDWHFKTRLTFGWVVPNIQRDNPYNIACTHVTEHTTSDDDDY